MLTIPITEREKLDKIIYQCSICYVGIIDEDGFPYVIPMNFGYDGNIIYLHSAPEGKSIRSLSIRPEACITFCSNTELAYQHQDVACSYRMKASSVICRGKIEFVEDLQQKEEALNFLMKQYSGQSFKYSEPALKNVKVWKMKIDSVSGKKFGAKNPKSVK